MGKNGADFQKLVFLRHVFELTKKELTQVRGLSEQTRKAVNFLCNNDTGGQGTEEGWEGKTEGD